MNSFNEGWKTAKARRAVLRFEFRHLRSTMAENAFEKMITEKDREREG